MNILDQIADTTEAADLLGLKRARVLQLIAAGDLSSKKVGRDHVLVRDEVLALAKERAEATSKPGDGLGAKGKPRKSGARKTLSVFEGKQISAKSLDQAVAVAREVGIPLRPIEAGKWYPVSYATRIVYDDPQTDRNDFASAYWQVGARAMLGAAILASDVIGEFEVKPRL